MAHALLKGRGYVIPDDVKEMVAPVLAHRLRLNFQASMNNRTAQDVVREMAASVPVPGASR